MRKRIALIGALAALGLLLLGQTTRLPDTKVWLTTENKTLRAGIDAGDVGGDVAADAIWDAKGDLAAGTGADTASKLAVGANDTFLVPDSGEATGLKYINAAAVKVILSLDNVENTALSTWTGTTSVTTLGTVTTGTWSATDIAVAAGGTGASDAATARTNLGVADTHDEIETLLADDDLDLGTGTLIAAGCNTGPVAEPKVLFQDSTNSAECSIEMDDGAGPDGRLTLRCDVAGALTDFIEIDAINGDIELGTPGTNYVDIATSGATTFVGTAAIDLESGAAPLTNIADGEVLVGTGAGTAAYIAGLAACAADAKIEYVPGSPDTFTCEAIGSLDISDDTNLAVTAPVVLTDDTVSVSAASTTAQGIIEIATGEETNTGTDDTLCVSPDALDDWTGSPQLVEAGALEATSLAVDPSATPGLNLRDSNMGGTPDNNVRLLGDCPNGTTAGGDEDCDVLLGAQSAGTFTGMVMIDTTDGGVTTLSLGATTDAAAPYSQPANRVEVSEGGVMSFAGTGDIDLSAKCTQVIAGFLDPTEAGATDDYLNLVDNTVGTTDAAEDEFVVPVALVAHTLKVSDVTDPGAAGDQWDITVMDDGGATALTCTVGNGQTSCNDTSNTPTIAADSDMTVLVISDGGATDPDASANMRVSFCLGEGV